MRELRIYKENEKILISGLRTNSSFEGLVNILIYKFTNKNEIIRNKLEKEYIYSIEFDEEAKLIYIVLDGIKYFISLDEKEIRNFKLGQYNDITYELKRLIVAFDKRKEIEEEMYVLEKELETKRLIKEKEDKIIKDGKKGVFIDEDAKKIYLEYLKKIEDNLFRDFIESIFGWIVEEEIIKPVYEKQNVLTDNVSSRYHRTINGYIDLKTGEYISGEPPKEIRTINVKVDENIEYKKIKITPSVSGNNKISEIIKKYNMESVYLLIMAFKMVSVISFVNIFFNDPQYHIILATPLASVFLVNFLIRCSASYEHFTSLRKRKKENQEMIKKLEHELSLSRKLEEEKNNNVSKEIIDKSIDNITNKLCEINNKDKILILEKLKRVLELSSLNESNAMLRLNIIKENLKYFDERKNAYMVDKPKRKVLKPNSNITNKTFTRG